MKTATVADRLHKHGLRVTPQRIWVYDYLDTNMIHPNCDEVYEALISKDKRLTRSTVYNVLQALVNTGLAVEVKVKGDCIRYDANTELHGHFVCTCCNSIYDFEIDKLEVRGLNGFKAHMKDVYFSGLCKKCLGATDTSNAMAREV